MCGYMHKYICLSSHIYIYLIYTCVCVLIYSSMCVYVYHCMVTYRYIYIYIITGCPKKCIHIKNNLKLNVYTFFGHPIYI